MAGTVPPPRFLENHGTAPHQGAEPGRSRTGSHGAHGRSTASTASWGPDILGPGYESRSLDLAPDDEGDVAATLVRYRPHGAVPSVRAVLYLHGWSDYFFQTQTAEVWHSLGSSFYALDLRKYGRSLRPGQTPGYVSTLRTYDEDLAAALDAIHADLGPHASIMLMGHSTGGLVAVLWAHRNPGATTGLVLNSPWLELQGSSVVRTVSAPAISQLARFQPKTPLPNIDPGFYARTIRRREGGEWDFDDRWRPMPAFPVRAGWLNAIIAGHAEVARGLTIAQPILMLASTRTMISARWHDQMRESDVVLDVELLARRAVQLGPTVTISRIAGGLHDLALSRTPARERYYGEIARWSSVYGWSQA
ncbi:alpha/beta hydrolase [Sanguibacter antarcticus]|uniref:Alpha-beta hydrolase superfamily lysophospholipase n=1 Tax=Sanguibacter antarcticus TaxID=372484 RepID=A0A2A9E8M3_9MICO|nr:alpha/beta hydrolase [Sanguibacter antarcticus]PFG35234.1 alpha-beta hydrolase superfamily lysophospholipase [Sanguibacter antarcticus]